MADNAVLSQREIDALLSGQDQDESAKGSEKASVERAARRSGQRIKPYDFKHPEKLSKEQFPKPSTDAAGRCELHGS